MAGTHGGLLGPKGVAMGMKKAGGAWWALGPRRREGPYHSVPPLVLSIYWSWRGVAGTLGGPHGAAWGRMGLRVVALGRIGSHWVAIPYAIGTWGPAAG